MALKPIPVLRVGKLEVVSSGSVIGYSAYPVTVDLDGTGQFIIEFRFVFDDTGNDTGNAIETKQIRDNYIVFELKNFTNPLGSGLKEPIQIGNYNTSTLHMNFVHYLIGQQKAINLLHYTFYAGAGLE